MCPAPTYETTVEYECEDVKMRVGIQMANFSKAFELPQPKNLRPSKFKVKLLNKPAKSTAMTAVTKTVVHNFRQPSDEMLPATPSEKVGYAMSTLSRQSTIDPDLHTNDSGESTRTGQTIRRLIPVNPQPDFENKKGNYPDNVYGFDMIQLLSMYCNF